MRKLVIIGAGGFGREVAWVIRRINEAAPTFELLGFCDDAEDKREGECGGYPLLGPLAAAGARLGAVGFFCAIGDNRARQAVTAKAVAAGLEPVSVVDPSAAVAPDVAVGRGSFVGVHAVVSAGAAIGEGVIVNHLVTIGHDARLGGYAQACPGVCVSGGCLIGEGVLLGSNACVIPGLRVGDWATVGAGAAVLREIGAGGGVVRISRG